MEKFLKHITLEEAKKLVSENEGSNDFAVLDVRTSEELESGVIGHPINIDIYDPDFSRRISELDKSKTYLVYCRSGNRSKAATGMMEKMGFRYIYEIDCGIAG